MNTMAQLSALFIATSMFLGVNTLAAAEHHVTAQDSDSNAVTAWQAFSCSGTIVQANVYDASTGFWSTPETLSTSDTATDPRVAAANVGGDLNAVVVWLELQSGKNVLYASIISSVSGSWAEATRISENTEDLLNEYDVSINNNGDIIATWASYDAFFETNVRSATTNITDNNSWASPVTGN